MQRAERIHTQRAKDKNKLYALHAPEAECIGKGKARNPYEFGVKPTTAIVDLGYRGVDKGTSGPQWRSYSVRSHSQPADLLTLCIGKSTYDQKVGIGMNGRSAKTATMASDQPRCLTGSYAVMRTHGFALSATYAPRSRRQQAAMLQRRRIS